MKHLMVHDEQGRFKIIGHNGLLQEYTTAVINQVKEMASVLSNLLHLDKPSKEWLLRRPRRYFRYMLCVIQMSLGQCHMSNCFRFRTIGNWNKGNHNTSEEARATFAHFQNWKELPSHICDEIKALKNNTTSSKYVAFFHTHSKSLDSRVCRTMISIPTPHLQEDEQNQPDDGHANQTAVTNAAWQSSAEHQRVADAQIAACNASMPSSSRQHAGMPPVITTDEQDIQEDGNCLPLPQKRARVNSTDRDDIATTRQDDEAIYDIILGASSFVSGESLDIRVEDLPPLCSAEIPDNFLPHGVSAPNKHTHA